MSDDLYFYMGMANHESALLLDALETDERRDHLKEVSRCLSRDDKAIFYSYLLGLREEARDQILEIYGGMSTQQRVFHTKEIIGEILSDGMTGLGNKKKFCQDIQSGISEVSKRYFDESSGVAERRIVESEVPYIGPERRGQRHYDLSLLIMDIDHFKQVNDTFGHHTGDRVLVDVASLVKATVRPEDRQKVYRVGGEEFAALIRHTTPDQGFAVANRIRRRVAVDLASALPDRGITISIGVSNYNGNPEFYDSAHPIATHLYNNADMALYAAKDNGRNCVQVYTPEMAETYARKIEKKHK